jgi:hypothetical protein
MGVSYGSQPDPDSEAAYLTEATARYGIPGPVVLRFFMCNTVKLSAEMAAWLSRLTGLSLSKVIERAAAGFDDATR